MRRLALISGVAFCSAALFMSACDDGGTSATDTTPPADTTATTPNDTTTTTPADTTPPADPCDPNPCTTAPADKCNSDNTKVVSFTAPGTCTDDGGSASCDFGAGTETPCGTDKVCGGGVCVDAGDPCDYTFDERVSIVKTILLASQADDGSDHCCFDYDSNSPKGDDDVDNALGEVLKLAADFVGDLNGTIKEQIDGGTLLLLLEMVGLDDLTTDSDFTINGFLGEDADDNLANNLTGNGAFLVDAASFVEGTATPYIVFPGASVTGGVMSAGPSLFSLSIPIVEGAVLTVDITDTRFEGGISAGVNGKGVALGAQSGTSDLGTKLGGVVKLTDLYGAINSFVETCECVDMSNTAEGTLITAAGKCDAGTDTSACGEDDTCGQIAGLCSALLLFITPDVDLDGDFENDAISIGVWLEAESATISGQEPACLE